MESLVGSVLMKDNRGGEPVTGRGRSGGRSPTIEQNVSCIDEESLVNEQDAHFIT